MSTIHAPKGYDPHTTERLLTQSDVADVLRVSRWTVARLVSRGELRGVRVSERRRFRKEEIDAYLDREGRAGGLR
jgi:excisionase family DNA binding protein